MSYDPRYLKGIELFNAHEFFDAHETWEELWHETHDQSKNFIRGLIQAATALHHFQNCNFKGAKLLHESFKELISLYPSPYLGIDVSKLLKEMNVCFEGLASYSVEALPGRYSPNRHVFPVQLDESKIPGINLIPSPCEGEG